MKSFQMKIFFLIVLSSAYLINSSGLKKNEEGSDRKHVIVDKAGSGHSLNHVVRRNPTVTYGEHVNRAVSSGSSNTLSFGNSNSNNGPSDLGKTAAIVGPSIVLSGSGTMSAIKETPAHVGWRHEKKTVTSLNKKSGKVEQHEVDSKIPLMGMVQEVKTLKTKTTRKYDIDSNTLGPISTSVSE